MKRTYDVFVDNGLFILAYYLDKEIEEITIQDIESNVEKMSERIFSFTGCEKYSNLKSMVFPNSALTQGGKKAKDLNDKIKENFNLKGTDICCRCGEAKANIFNSINKTYVPGIVSLTMYNYSNNLQGVNICPHCLALTVFSILNCRVIQEVILYNHTDNDFMYDYTEKIQEQNNGDISLNVSKDKKNESTKVDLIKEMWGIKVNKYYNGSLEQVRFNNIGLGMPTFEVKTLDDKDIEMFNKLSAKRLWDEFITPEYYLLINMLEGRITESYTKNIIKFDKTNNRYEIKCSKKLLEFLNKEVNRLDSKTIAVIDKICDGIVELKKVQESYKTLRYLPEGVGIFENFLMDTLNSYLDLNGEKLFDSDEIIMLTNRMKYRRIKNLMIVKLIERM
ncbi:hypothetical protein [uncultured Clostridium sp.]|jgi:CRISPR-associated protein Cst1|uniref:hypothetical protein n=1 Tax=uncultured Clostridium sp. TaxID=59620 RepID=UPI002601BD77|nr:hypothetical protein [uncultured Clostridium sp.]